jgi:hypothetical protein
LIRPTIENLQHGKTALLAKAMYLLTTYQEPLVMITSQYSSSAAQACQTLLLQLCGLVSLASTFSPKLRQLLGCLEDLLQAPKHLDQSEYSALRVLLSYHLGTDDRRQVHNLIRNLELNTEMAGMLIRSIVERHKGGEKQKTLNKDSLHKLETHLTNETNDGVLKKIEDFEEQLSRLRMELEASIVNLGKPTKIETKEFQTEFEVG